MIQSKKGQIEGLIGIVIIGIVIIVVGLILLFLNLTVLDKFSNAVRPLSNDSANAVQYGSSTFVNLWDTVIIVVFFINVIILLISSFLPDYHPAFIVVYIIAAFFLFMFIQTYVTVIDKIWNQFPTVTQYLPQTQWLYQNYGYVLLGIYFVTGAIMFTKFVFFNSNARSTRSY